MKAMKNTELSVFNSNYVLQPLLLPDESETNVIQLSRERTVVIRQ